MAKVLIIGAQNIDIFAKSTSEFIPHDSNPAKIHLAFGGVGRNIAENLCRLGNEVHFITVFGDDIFSDAAHKSLAHLGVNTCDSLFLKNQTNSVYLGILDQENDLFLGLNDMEISKALNPSFLKTKAEFIRSFELLVLDNNLKTETLHYLLNTYQEKTIVMDAVSAKKALKLEGFLDKITVLKLNKIELQALSSQTALSKQLEELHRKGAKSLLITNKDQDVFLSNPKGMIKKKPIHIDKIINATGAGDAFLSGFIHGNLHQFNDEQKLNYANRVAHITLKSNNSTSESLSLKEINKYE